MRVLVVEDEATQREILSEYLRREGHEPQAVPDGNAGLEEFRSGSYDLVVTDRAMPEMDGVALAEGVKETSPETPVILVTGFGEMMDAAGEKPNAVDIVLSKPLTLDGLRDAIAKITD